MFKNKDIKGSQREDMFNIYYVNDTKAFEISMLFDNKVLDTVSIDNTKSLSAKISASLGLSSLIGGDIEGEGSRSVKTADAFNVISTISTILRPIYRNAAEYTEGTKPGSLIIIKDIPLKVTNYNMAFFAKALINGKSKTVDFKEKIPDRKDGDNEKNKDSPDQKKPLNIGPIAEILLKNYTYIISGDALDRRFIMRIPIEKTDNEMENRYDIKEITIGKVTVLGIYRGEISEYEYRQMRLFDENILQEIAYGKIDLIENSDKPKKTAESNEAGKSGIIDGPNSVIDESIKIMDRIYKSENPESIEEIAVERSKMKKNMLFIDLIAIVQDIEPASGGDDRAHTDVST
jgi:hypothetical protein